MAWYSTHSVLAGALSPPCRCPPGGRRTSVFEYCYQDAAGNPDAAVLDDDAVPGSECEPALIIIPNVGQSQTSLAKAAVSV